MSVLQILSEGDETSENTGDNTDAEGAEKNNGGDFGEAYEGYHLHAACRTAYDG